MSDQDTTAATAAGDAGNGGASDGPASGNGQERTFTQEDLERIVQQRLAREQGKYADYEELKQKASRVDDLEQAQQSETDKLRGKAERETQRRTEAEQKAIEAVERANKALTRAAVVAAAAKANAADPHDVYTLLMASDQAQGITIDENGDVTGATEAVGEYLKAKPHLLKRSGGFDGGQQGGSSSAVPSMNDLIRAEAGFGARVT